MNVSNNIFSYKILSEEIKMNQSKILKHIKSIKSIKLSKFKFSSHKLLCILDFTKWYQIDTHFIYLEGKYDERFEEWRIVLYNSGRIFIRSKERVL